MFQQKLSGIGTASVQREKTDERETQDGRQAGRQVGRNGGRKGGKSARSLGDGIEERAVETRGFPMVFACEFYLFFPLFPSLTIFSPPPTALRQTLTVYVMYIHSRTYMYPPAHEFCVMRSVIPPLSYSDARACESRRIYDEGNTN